MQRGPEKEEERIRVHSQWQKLCASMSKVLGVTSGEAQRIIIVEHGIPEEPLKGQGWSDKLSNRLLGMHFVFVIPLRRGLILMLKHRIETPSTRGSTLRQ